MKYFFEELQQAVEAEFIKSGLSQKRFAEMFSVSPGTIRRIIDPKMAEHEKILINAKFMDELKRLGYEIRLHRVPSEKEIEEKEKGRKK